MKRRRDCARGCFSHVMRAPWIILPAALVVLYAVNNDRPDREEPQLSARPVPILLGMYAATSFVSVLSVPVALGPVAIVIGDMRSFGGANVPIVFIAAGWIMLVATWAFDAAVLRSVVKSRTQAELVALPLTTLPDGQAQRVIQVLEAERDRAGIVFTALLYFGLISAALALLL